MALGVPAYERAPAWRQKEQIHIYMREAMLMRRVGYSLPPPLTVSEKGIWPV